MWAIALLLACWACAGHIAQRAAESPPESPSEESLGKVELWNQLKPFARLLLEFQPTTLWHVTSAAPRILAPSEIPAVMPSSRAQTPTMFGERKLASKVDERGRLKKEFRTDARGQRKGGPLQRKLVRVKPLEQIAEEKRQREEAFNEKVQERQRSQQLEKRFKAARRPERQDEGKQGRQGRPAGRGSGGQQRARIWKDAWEDEDEDEEMPALPNAEEIEAHYDQGGSLLDDYDGRIQVRLFDEGSRKPIMCDVAEDIEVNGVTYASLVPVDAPVTIVELQGENGEEIIEIDDDDKLDDLFPSAEYQCKELGLTLKRTPVELTVAGLEETGDTDDDNVAFENDDDGMEMDELVPFLHRGRSYAVYRLLEPVFIIGRQVRADDFCIPSDEEVEEVSPPLEAKMTTNARDKEDEQAWRRHLGKKKSSSKKNPKKPSDQEKGSDFFDDLMRNGDKE